MSVGRQSFLVVFDFDHTVVDCNTDTVIPEFLGRGEEHKKLIQAKAMQWTKLMDTMIAPYSKEELVNAAHKSVKVDDGMHRVFEFLRRQQTHNEGGSGSRMVPGFVEVDIASDSNLLFIEATLEGCLPNARQCITQIHSNPFYDVREESQKNAGRAECYGPTAPKDSQNKDDESSRDATHNQCRARKSRVCWYEPYGHACECCTAKPNMCKSLIIKRLLSTTRLIDPTVIFVGDGANDYCPVLNVLRPRDFIFARRGFPLHKLLSSSVEGEVGGCCGVGLWSNAAEMLSLFENIIENKSVRLPTLSRFRDANPKEFRSITLNNRLPDIIARTITDNDAFLSKTGRAALEKLLESYKNNGPVPCLPGQRVLPAWLRNYAYTIEYDATAKDPAARASVVDKEDTFRGVAPRWGQLPWLHGEIYGYHLVWQYVLMQDGINNGDAATVVNNVGVHTLHNPLYSQHSGVTQTQGMVSPAVVAMQGSADDAVITQAPLRVRAGVIASMDAKSSNNNNNTVVDYADVADPANSGLIPSRDVSFGPYRDIFQREKENVLINFISLRVVPMLLCEPWHAPETFCAVLLRWMLWGNGLDLSMFTLEQLSLSHNTARQHNTAEVEGIREAEKASAVAQDTHLVGNEVTGVEARILEIIAAYKKDDGSAAKKKNASMPNRIDIVMDNVGVECIADLCFGLWFIEKSANTKNPPVVMYHVKPQPYYVSDVTPSDFDITLDLLTKHSAGKPEAEAVVLMQFVDRVRAAFASGSFTVDADTVWTQPSEYRELPPRVVNRYFYIQHVDGSSDAASKGKSATARAAYDANKSLISPRTSLVIFKGDLNFRRVVGDRFWNQSDFLVTLDHNKGSHDDFIRRELLADTDAKMTTESPSFETIVSAYWPTHTVPVCCVRTIKSECCVGVPADVKSRLDKEAAEGISWRISGKYGVILYAA